MSNEGKKRLHNLTAVDERGSMEAIREQALVGMNDTIETIKKMEMEHEGGGCTIRRILQQNTKKRIKILLGDRRSRWGPVCQA